MNPSVFVRAGDRIELGVEGNVEIGGAGHASWLSLPQAHLSVSRAFTLQVGVGLAGASDAVHPVGMMRAVLGL